MLSIVIGFRNRDYTRVENVLKSLAEQTNSGFELVFVDYGSDDHSTIQTLVESYPFTHYIFSDTRGWLWNRGHAINTGVQAAKGDTIFISDIDNLYHPDFVERVSQLDLDSKFYTLGCYYLPENFDYHVIKKNPAEIPYRECYGMGLSVMKKDDFFGVNGYDEYFLVWGAEDDDLTTKLINKGLKRIHCTCGDFPMFHQWHPVSSPQKPSPWYLTMVQYLYNKPKSAVKKEKGIFINPLNRPVLQHVEKGTYTKGVKIAFCEDPQFLFFNPVIYQFSLLPEGEVAWLEYTVKETPLPKQGLVDRVLNKPLAIPSPSIDIKDIENFLNYFIGTNRDSMEDYYTKIEGNSVLFVCCKKVTVTGSAERISEKSIALC